MVVSFEARVDTLVCRLARNEEPRLLIELPSYANRTKMEPLSERCFIYYLLSDALAELLIKLTRYFRSRCVQTPSPNTQQLNLFDLTRG